MGKKNRAKQASVRLSGLGQAQGIALTVEPPYLKQLRVNTGLGRIESFKKLTPFTPLLIVLAVGFLPYLIVPQAKAQWGDFLNISLGLTIEALPFLLIGAIGAAILSTWKSRSAWITRTWKKITGNRAGATAAGIGLGFALPVCECGTASIARQVTREGAPVAMSIGFLLAAPVVNPVTILATWIAFGGDLGFVLGRVGLCLALATGIGLFFSLHPHPHEIFKPGLVSPAEGDTTTSVSDESLHLHHQAHAHLPGEGEGGDNCHNNPADHTLLLAQTKINYFFYQCFSEFIMAAKVALPGISLAAAFQAYISPGFFLNMGQGAVLSVAVLMLLAGLMSVCSSVDAFVALSFTGVFPGGAILAFLVFGPLINLKSLFLFRLVLRPAVIWLLSLLCFSFILLVGVIINFRIV